MNLFSITWSYISRRKLITLLNVLLLALGIGTIVLLMLFSRQLESNLTKNAEGIDLVVGAKGSPLQVILSSVYHIDAPTGNIPVTEAQQIMQHPMVEEAIPLALGDTYRGLRIVGTTPAYLDHYEAQLTTGRLWQATYEVVVGAGVAEAQNLDIGSTLISTHGLAGVGEDHPQNPLRVVGLLSRTGTVLDRLIVTSIETVWAVHGVENAAGRERLDAESVYGRPDTTGEARDTASTVAGQRRPGLPPSSETRLEYTSVLVKYRSPVAAAMLPRFINRETNMQAASPAVQTTRLFSLLGVGIDAARAFGWILVFTAALGVFIALYNALKERRFDLAMMRTLGASRGTLFRHLILEGVVLTSLGTLVGLALGHTATHLLGSRLSAAQTLEISGLALAPAELLLVVLALALGVVCAIIPALQAYRTDIARTLARNG